MPQVPAPVKTTPGSNPARKYFGTDGIRGTANREPMTAEIALKVGMAAGLEFSRGDHRHRVVIAKDTRLSGYMIENALTAGFISVGMDVLLVGPVPTPAVAMLTRSMRADIGVMISASHNAFRDNGIKLFGPDGFKLSDEVEARIEARMQNGLSDHLAEPDMIGRAKRLDDARGRYIEYVKRATPRDLRLDGLKIAIDCANGAAYQIGPIILWELGAEVIPLGVEPNGFNINHECGSTHPERLQREVLAQGADLGIALDGDADRLVMCDENGKLIDGDQLMAMITRFWQKTGQLKGGGIVATQMSNLGLEHYLQSLGLALHRTRVGDRYVMEQMRERGINIGGEPSGHIILGDHSTTGDGLIAALQILSVLREDGRKLSEAGAVFTPVPQVMRNLRYSGENPLNNPRANALIESTQAELGGTGRVLVRASGTEPLVRIMVEGQDAKQIETLAEALLRQLEALPAAARKHA